MDTWSSPHGGVGITMDFSSFLKLIHLKLDEQKMKMNFPLEKEVRLNEKPQYHRIPPNFCW